MIFYLNFRDTAKYSEIKLMVRKLHWSQLVVKMMFSITLEYGIEGRRLENQLKVNKQVVAIKGRDKMETHHILSTKGHTFASYSFFLW